MNIGLLPAQKELLQSKKKRVLMLGGIGTGKTHTLALQALLWAIEYPKSKFLVCANTYTQLMNATVPAIIEVLEQHNIPGIEIKTIIPKTTTKSVHAFFFNRFMRHLLRYFRHLL